MNFNDDHDHETPNCAVCGDRVGLHNDASIMLKGQFFFDKQNGYAMFILDPDTKIGFVELPDALGPGQSQFAIIINADAPAPIVPLHESCAEDELQLNEEEEEDEDEVPDLDDLDAQMHQAMERDRTFWDQNDLLHLDPRRTR